MKKRVWAIIITLAVAIAGVFLWMSLTDNSQTVRLGSHSFQATILRTDIDRQRGLSGSKNLPTNRAIVFDFEADSKWGIWMKDMNYPIDIVWVDAHHKIVHIVQNAQPSSYPETIFRPDTDSRYVIELASGTIKNTGVKKGDSITFPPDM